MPLQHNTFIRATLLYTDWRGQVIHKPLQVTVLETTKLQKRASAAAVMARAAVSNKKYYKMRRRWRTLTAKIKARAK